MDDSLFVRRFPCFGNLLGDAEKIEIRRSKFENRGKAGTRFSSFDFRVSIFQQLRQGWAFNQFHHQRAIGCRFFQAVNRRDIGVIERGEHLCFALEARHALDIVSSGPVE
jgi:hypothetical protein